MAFCKKTLRFIYKSHLSHILIDGFESPFLIDNEGAKIFLRDRLKERSIKTITALIVINQWIINGRIQL
ncbi:hypothetical protein C7H79_14705 [Nitrosomonas supralitoralis]|uniref:Uncharacterized protein n=1 Tax=Nitrosomonas supralitoralis TaxID=2116706 RepID=A0A2P7NRW5_9PROT|nr:hypothetical protein C7H79_14705 [Nitrosomonas supralitoralis]